ncbi:hypothetical protein [Paenibacillus qinlingensis]|uniref:hypothetical protein n=1 Tax=Paenibacillus qinlingensis TaxID=1837343 RepID=UPI00286DA7A1|nr:hypothetical protein [Paenibacillus qinlingensis]
MLAIFLVSRTHIGTTATELSQLIKVTYKTAWLILQKIRTSIQQADNHCPLTGSILINSAIYGRPFNPTVHRHPQEQLLLIGSSIDQAAISTMIKIKHVIPNQPHTKHITKSDTYSFQQKHIDPMVETIELVTGFYTSKKQRPLLEFAKQVSTWLSTTFTVSDLNIFKRIWTNSAIVSI